ncbi:cholesterol 7-desaturase nvd-like [Antedon mediterranea]|uniref:cholesterol 7-desaturase nvd-like n=1 Tax=Antedon mediterranea TaxID=105859 RepID=UPI003AF9D798
MLKNWFVSLILIIVSAILIVAVTAASPGLSERLKIFGLPLGSNLADVGHLLEQHILEFVKLQTPISVLCYSLSTYVLYKLYYILFAPLYFVRKHGDVGYIIENKSINKKDVANDIKRRRKAGEVPPVYPNGWFRVIESRFLKVFEVKYVSMLGEELAVYRGEDGKAHVVNAYCPHLGANLGVGGQVKGNCIECPFHGWKFRGEDGKCVDIPYASKVPEFAKIKSWPSIEIYGLVLMWYHAENSEPLWYPPEIPNFDKMRYQGYTEHQVNAHIQEVPENGADINHLTHLHTPFILSGTDLRYSAHSFWDWITHGWDGNWKQDENDKHIGELTLLHKLSLFGIEIKKLNLNVTATQVGPSIVHLTFKTFLGTACMVHSITPVEPLVQKITHSIYVTGFIPTIVGKFLLWAEAVQIERDVMIWNHKTYVDKPLLVKEDHLIAKHRRWYSQFYSENSPRLKLQKDTLDF